MYFMSKYQFLFIICLCSSIRLFADTVLEPWTYSENFEDRALGAWASYPLWQDTAYDPNFRIDEMVPGDPNISIVQKVTPYTHVDNYAGAQKLLDMYLTSRSKIKFRYYVKTHLAPEFIKVRFAAGELGKLDVTIPAPKTNTWEWVTVDFNDVIKENPGIMNKEQVKIYALAILTKIPKADPKMPFYLGLDDIVFEGERDMVFRFSEPTMHKLPEYKPFIPEKPYHYGDEFKLKGEWLLQATKVQLELVSYTDREHVVYKGRLSKKNGLWTLSSMKLSFPDGLYLGKLTAYQGSKQLSDTEFTIHIAPKVSKIDGVHPRLLYDDEKKKWIQERFKQPQFEKVYNDIAKKAREERGKVPVESLVFDLDQFPDEDWLPTWSAWGSHIYSTDGALRMNAMAYTFHGDKEAGMYVKNVLLKLSEWPNWGHPWQIKRGRFSEHRTGSWSHRVAEAYDLTYDLMTDEESSKIRKAIIDNIVKGSFRTYVYNDNITSNTSNWLGMISGGAMMSMAAIYGDGPDVENLEPYFTGTMMKYYEFITKVTDSNDGSWGEGLGYNNYTFSNMGYSVPSLKNVFNIDLSAPLIGTYNEYIWGGIIKDRHWFEYGDSGGNMNPATNWAFLLDMQKEPRLGWFYNYLKKGGYIESNTQASNGDSGIKEGTSAGENETIQDVFYDTKNVKEDSPFDESPVKMFKNVGTTVFKSGWEKDDFVFVMRTGAFYNHQHLDQGSFWLADRGNIFIEERHLKNSNYYDDPLYQPWLTQPVGHSTILIDGNHQSQRVGDPLNFAPGFDDHAFIDQFLDGKKAAFSAGDIGRLYWGKVKSLTRNVVYLKPRTLLMLDIAVPNEEDHDVTLLYQTLRLEDIKADKEASSITKGGSSLNIVHLSPSVMDVEAVETPHYLKTLLNVRPLEREGMLTVTARTQGKPLVMANVLSVTDEGSIPDVDVQTHDGFVSGTIEGNKIAFTTEPGQIYSVEEMETDAVSVVWDNGVTFVASATVFSRNGHNLLKSDLPMTFEVSGQQIKFYRISEGKVTIGVSKRPSSVKINGKRVKNYTYKNSEKTIELSLPQGEGVIVTE